MRKSLIIKGFKAIISEEENGESGGVIAGNTESIFSPSQNVPKSKEKKEENNHAKNA